MSVHDELADRFEAERPRLRSIASRMLGSDHEADDVVQETWLRLSRNGGNGIDNLPGWLTTVLSRICLDQLRARVGRNQIPLDDERGDLELPASDDPEADAVLADAVGSALLVMLDRLTPAERVAFVLHDSFGVSFDEIAPIVGRTPATTRQLASRARRKIAGATPQPVTSADDLVLIDAFLTASRNGDMAALVGVLAQGVAVHADATAASYGVEPVVNGVERVAEFFNGRAAAAFLARIGDRYGAIWMMQGKPRVAFHFTVRDGVIERIDLVGDPERLGAMDYELVHDNRRT